MRVHAALADELQLVQTIEQGSLDLGPFADEDQCLGVLQARRERVYVLDVIVPDFDLVAIQLPKTGKRP